MADRKSDQTDLENLFTAARHDAAELPDGLLDRVLADAYGAQPSEQVAAAPIGSPVRPTRWRQLRAVLGGWPGIAGLAAACAAGIWLGVAPPDFLPDPVQIVTQSDDGFDLFDSEQLALLSTEEG